MFAFTSPPPRQPPASQTAPAAVGRVRVKRRLHAKRLLVCEPCTYIKGCAERGEQREAFQGVGIEKQSQREREREFSPVAEARAKLNAGASFIPFRVPRCHRQRALWLTQNDTNPRQPRRRDTRHYQGRTRTENRTRLCFKFLARNCLRMVIGISSHFPFFFSFFLY